jgi:hypothetical protein
MRLAIFAGVFWRRRSAARRVRYILRWRLRPEAVGETGPARLVSADLASGKMAQTETGD